MMPQVPRARFCNVNGAAVDDAAGAAVDDGVA